MDQKIKDALARFQATGDGSSVSPEDMDAITEFMVNTMIAAGVPYTEARDVVSIHKWGSWAQGWDTGYASGIRRGASKSRHEHCVPKFNLNGS